MPKPTPVALGAALGITFMTGLVAWQRLRPTPCTGGVTLDLRPPLGEPGRYRFRLELAGTKEPCEFEVPLPLRERVDLSHCGPAVALETRVEAERTRILGLTVGASPSELLLRISREGELLYDTRVAPVYGPYETPREEDRRFCGRRARLAPACVNGSSACTPFEARCDGPEDCPEGKVCCANADWGREYGPETATACESRRRCLDRFGSVACHSDADCPSDMSCSDGRLAKDFEPALRACQAR